MLGVLGILRLRLFWACFSLWGYLVYFILAPFWSLRYLVYLVYFGCVCFGLALASGVTWYISFWLRFGASGTWCTWYTSVAFVLGLL